MAMIAARGFFRESYHTLPLKRRTLPTAQYTGWARTLISGSLARDNNFDVVVVGGGVMGWSSAFFLGRRIPGDSICVIERDTKLEKASTVLSVGSIRQQFSVEGNVRMSMYSSSFIKEIGKHLQVEGHDPPDVQFVEGGYLLLASEHGEEVMRKNFETQRCEGAAVELLTSSQLRERFPWLNTAGVVLGSLGVRNEGWFDPWLLLTAFRQKAVATGVHYLHGEVTGVGVCGDMVNSVQVTLPSGQLHTIRCNHLVNASGAWAQQVAHMAGIGQEDHPNATMRAELPVRPRKRCVFVFKCPSGPATDCPLIVDPSGIYFRREGTDGTYICGCSPLEDVDGEDFEVDYSLFEDRLWPVLAERVPAFESLKLQSAWAGLYEYNTFDQNGIIGPHPVLQNLVFANGFSGHGIQQSPAVGRAISEVILDGRTHSIDLSDFGFRRIVDGKPLRENNIV